MQFPQIVPHPYLEPRYQPTHHIRSFTLVVLLAVVTFLAAIVLAAHYGPVR